MSLSKYIQEVCENIREYRETNHPNITIKKKLSTPFHADYHPDEDDSNKIEESEIGHFQHMLGMLRWIVELGQIDIITEVSTLASHMACPREDHLHAGYCMFEYIARKHNSRIILDPTYPDINDDDFSPNKG